MSNIFLTNYWWYFGLQVADAILTLTVLHYEHSKSKDWNQAISSERNIIARLLFKLTGPKFSFVFPIFSLYFGYLIYWNLVITNPYWTFYVMGIYTMVVLTNAISLYDMIQYWKSRPGVIEHLKNDNI